MYGKTCDADCECDACTGLGQTDLERVIKTGGEVATGIIRTLRQPPTFRMPERQVPAIQLPAYSEAYQPAAALPQTNWLPWILGGLGILLLVRR